MAPHLALFPVFDAAVLQIETDTSRFGTFTMSGWWHVLFWPVRLLLAPRPHRGDSEIRLASFTTLVLCVPLLQGTFAGGETASLQCQRIVQLSRNVSVQAQR